MTMSFIQLGKLDDGRIVYKCFYGDERSDYGEFYLNVDWRKGEMTFASKDTWYASVLTNAFRASMSQM